MRELTYYVACSVDGFIAHADGSVPVLVTAGTSPASHRLPGFICTGLPHNLLRLCRPEFAVFIIQRLPLS